MRRHAFSGFSGALALVLPVLLDCCVRGESMSRDEPHRPQIHFSSERNWINDPNGPIWYDGSYHLFYQYNPEGPDWGNMSWGHAVSTDLVHWQERPVSIPYSEREHIFSGTVVVDEADTSGFGELGEPALVAAYTSWDPESGVQAQSLAYSVDKGETWAKYEGNPVLDLGSREFRDPKVFWYEPGGYWVMAVVMATERTVKLYRSDDLKAWTHLSDFGPANAVGGVWEMPDLFELPVDGDPSDTRWVLVVSLNPGSVAGGSGSQYFLGDFDGTTFTADDLVTDNAPPEGTVLADFETSAHGSDWTVTGSAFGAGPVTGSLPGQTAVSGHRGDRLLNSFMEGDRSQGTLTSPSFVLTKDYVNLLVGGGRNPHQPEAGDGSAPPGAVLADFESTGWDGWTTSGDAFGDRPTAGDAPCQVGVTGYLGHGLANSYRNGIDDDCDPAPDTGTGTLTSPTFTVDASHIGFLVGGGPHDETAVRLLVDGQVVRSTSGSRSGSLNWAGWDVTDLAGKQAQIEIRDASTAGWGHIMADHFVLSDQPAVPRSTETSVNLVVDGEVVRTATGRDSETLDWVAWDVRDLVGRSARIQVVDNSSSSWGHVLADEFSLSDRPATPLLERYRWLDHGKDFYAALTFENAPENKRIAIAWMNNWEYASQTPTGTWRGSMSLPRELRLETIDGEVRLTGEPLDAMSGLRDGGAAYRITDRTIREGVTPLPESASGSVLEITAVFEPGEAREFGLHVRGGDGERTVIGYDVDAEKVFVDRTDSGEDSFHPAFAGVHAGPLALRNGRVRLTVYVDRSSVEVFAGSGETVITDLVYPRPGSDDVALYAVGGSVEVPRLTVRPLRSIWR